MWIWLSACAPEFPILGGDECATPRQTTIGCAIDGDTVALENCGDGERVRLLGIDAPEVAGSAKADCYANEATDVLAGWVSQAVVRMTFDQTCTDVYERTLAWVFLDVDEEDVWIEALPDPIELDEDGTSQVLVNELMVRVGAARVYDEGFARDVAYYDRLLEAQSQAKAEQLGLWGACED